MTKTKSVAAAVKVLQKKFPAISGIKAGEEWGGSDYDRAIFLGNAAEGGEIEGIPAAEYYAYPTMDPQEKIWEGGIHRELIKALEDIGYFAEWNDPGTIFAWPID